MGVFPQLADSRDQLGSTHAVQTTSAPKFPCGKQDLAGRLTRGFNGSPPHKLKTQKPGRLNRRAGLAFSALKGTP